MIDLSTLSHKDLCDLCVSLKQQRDELLLAVTEAIADIGADHAYHAQAVLSRAKHKAEKTNEQRRSIATER